MTYNIEAYKKELKELTIIGLKKEWLRLKILDVKRLIKVVDNEISTRIKSHEGIE